MKMLMVIINIYGSLVCTKSKHMNQPNWAAAIYHPNLAVIENHQLVEVPGFKPMSV